jgi:hypothetical protein
MRPADVRRELDTVIATLQRVRSHRGGAWARELDVPAVYRVIRQLFVLGARMQGRDFYARSTK